MNLSLRKRSVLITENLLSNHSNLKILSNQVGVIAFLCADKKGKEYRIFRICGARENY